MNKRKTKADDVGLDKRPSIYGAHKEGRGHSQVDACAWGGLLQVDVHKKIRAH